MEIKLKQFFHHGKRNLVLTLNYLRDQGFLNFDDINELTLLGASAGAIGSLLNADLISSYFSNLVEKKMIIDSPGMHFSDDFWDQFSSQYLTDFLDSTKKFQVNDQILNTGLLAKFLPQICQYYHDWQLAFVQSTQDPIMSLMFSQQSLKDHKRLVLSKEGVYEQSKKIKNCYSWVTNSIFHTFFLFPNSIVMRSSQSRVFAFDFIQMFLNKKLKKSYK